MSSVQAAREEFKCAYQGYRGRLIASAGGLAFSSEQLNVDFPWEHVKNIRVTTKHLKDVPTSMLEVKVSRCRQQHPQKSQIGGKHYFYNFDDIVTTAEEIKKFKDVPTSPAVVDLANDDSYPAAAENSAYVNNITTAVRKGSVCGVNSGVQQGGSSFFHCDKLNNGDVTVAPPQYPIDDGDFNHGVFRSRQGGHTARECDEDRRSNVFLPNSSGNPRLLFAKSRPLDKEHNSLCSPQQNQSSKRKPGGGQNNGVMGVLRRLLQLNGPFLLDARLQAVIGVLLLVIPVLFLVIMNTEAWWAPTEEGKLEKIIRDLDGLQQWQKRQQGQQGLGSWEKTPEGPASVTLSDVTEAVKGLIRRFVSRQHELTFLRLRRLRRLATGDEPSLSDMEGVLLNDLIAADNEGIQDESADGRDMRSGDVLSEQQQQQAPPRRFSLARVKHDLDRLISFIWQLLMLVRRALLGGGSNRKAKQGTSRASTWLPGFFGLGRDKADVNEGKGLVRYAERLANGQTVTEYIGSEEAEERRSCVKLTRSLVASADLLEGVLLRYMGTVLMSQYQAYLNLMQSSAGVSFSTSLDSRGPPAFASSSSPQTPTERRDVVRSEVAEEQNSWLLQAIALRRHASLLLDMEPLAWWGEGYDLEGQRHRTRSFMSEARSDKEEMPQTPVSGNKISRIVTDFVKETHNKLLSSSNISSPGLMFRNILKEVRYWSKHEEEWQDLVLWQLNMSRGNATGEGRGNESMRIMGTLPLFRGQWCFLEEPIELLPDSGDSSEGGSRTGTKDGRTAAPPLRKEGHYSHRRPEEESHHNGTCIYPAEVLSAFPSGVNSLFFQGSLTCVCDEHGVVQDDDKDETKGDPNHMNDLGEDNIPGESVSDNRARLRDVEFVSREVQLRWDNALELLFSAHNPEKGRGRGRGTRQRSWTGSKAGDSESWWEREGLINDENAEGEDDIMSNGEREMAKIRKRLLQLFVGVGKRYDQYLFAPAPSFPWSAATLLKCTSEDCSCQYSLRSSVLAFLWPPSWLRSAWVPHPLQEWLRHIKAGDPVVRRLYRQLLHIPLGEVEDVSWVLLNTMTLSQELLEIKHGICVLAYCEVFVLVAVIAAVVVLFLV